MKVSVSYKRPGLDLLSLFVLKNWSDTIIKNVHSCYFSLCIYLGINKVYHFNSIYILDTRVETVSILLVADSLVLRRVPDIRSTPNNYCLKWVLKLYSCPLVYQKIMFLMKMIGSYAGKTKRSQSSYKR